MISMPNAGNEKKQIDYNLAASKTAIKNQTKAQIEAFVGEINKISQTRVPVKTGHLKDSWWQTVEQMTDTAITISFGYDTKWADPRIKGSPKNYAMPVDYRTLFFTTALRKTKKKFGRRWGKGAVQDITTPTVPGRADKSDTKMF
ncbi:hypothetical protein GF357_05100 [Candidatus Dojkabacteria bacterium]|nr:hypothetical protein [Candidatus Dojkabacteria bacterium]